VFHQIGLGHHRDGRQILSRHRVGIDVCQTAAVPSRSSLCRLKQRPKALIAKAVQPLERPCQQIGSGWKPVSEGLHVTLPVKLEVVTQTELVLAKA
jgi:hypothetical protein